MVSWQWLTSCEAIQWLVWFRDFPQVSCLITGNFSVQLQESLNCICSVSFLVVA